MGVLRIKYVDFIWKFTGEWYVFDTYQLHVTALKYESNNNIKTEIEKSKTSVQFSLIFWQSGDVLFLLYACRLRGYTATLALFYERTFPWSVSFSAFDALCSSMIVPHWNHSCRKFTKWPIAGDKSNHKWRIILAVESWRIDQKYFVKWRSTYVISP